MFYTLQSLLSSSIRYLKVCVCMYCRHYYSISDVARLIVDQGTILDRIDFNIEQTDLRVKSALKSVKKAENYQQKNRKMMCIVVLSGAIVFFVILLILFKL
jgi:t-SNARE complex subunit (syntaxin)